jgi:hypothetical protein
MNQENKSEEKLEEYDPFPLWTKENYHDSGILLLSRTMHELAKVCGLFLDYHFFTSTGYRVSADGSSIYPYIEFRERNDEENELGKKRLISIHQYFRSLNNQYGKRIHIGNIEFLPNFMTFEITAEIDGAVEGRRNPENELLGFAINLLYTLNMLKKDDDSPCANDWELPLSKCSLCGHEFNDEDSGFFTLCRHIVDGTATNIDIRGYHTFECKDCSIKLWFDSQFDQIDNICYPCFVQVYTNWRRKQLGSETPLAQD